MYDNPYTQIVGNMDKSGLLDRTAWMFRRHFKDYMMMSFITFAFPFVLVMSLLILTKSDLFVEKGYDKLIGLFAAGSFLVFPLSMMLFSVWSELAMSYYTHKKIELEEVDWWQAIRATFTISILGNLLTKVLQFMITMLVAIFGALTLFVPMIGSILYFWIVVGNYTFFSALYPMIRVAEPHLSFGNRWARNRSLVSKKTVQSFTSSMVGFFILLGLLFFIYLSIGLILYWIVLPYFKQAGSDLISLSAFRQFMSIIFSIITALVFMVAVPTKSIFFAMMYYDTASKKDAYHLEYQIRMYNKLNPPKVHETTKNMAS